MDVDVRSSAMSLVRRKCLNNTLKPTVQRLDDKHSFFFSKSGSVCRVKFDRRRIVEYSRYTYERAPGSVTIGTALRRIRHRCLRIIGRKFTIVKRIFIPATGVVPFDDVAVHVETLVGASGGRAVRAKDRKAEIVAHTGPVFNGYVLYTPMPTFITRGSFTTKDRNAF